VCRLLVFILSVLFLKARLKYAIFLPYFIFHKCGKLPDQLSSTFFLRNSGHCFYWPRRYIHIAFCYSFFWRESPRGRAGFLLTRPSPRVPCQCFRSLPLCTLCQPTLGGSTPSRRHLRRKAEGTEPALRRCVFCLPPFISMAGDRPTGSQAFQQPHGAPVPTGQRLRFAAFQVEVF